MNYKQALKTRSKFEKEISNKKDKIKSINEEIGAIRKIIDEIDNDIVSHYLSKICEMPNCEIELLEKISAIDSIVVDEDMPHSKYMEAIKKKSNDRNALLKELHKICSHKIIIYKERYIDDEFGNGGWCGGEGRCVICDKIEFKKESMEQYSSIKIELKPHQLFVNYKDIDFRLSPNLTIPLSSIESYNDLLKVKLRTTLTKSEILDIVIGNISSNKNVKNS